MNDTSPAFGTLNLLPALMATLEQAGYKRPSPVQAQALPVLLGGRDLLASAQTGSGKTAAYVLPMLQHLAGTEASRQPGAPRALVLVPTRELAMQTAGVCRQLGRQLPLRTRVACGGMSRDNQIEGLNEGTDILVATPGRLIDLLDGGHLHLSQVCYLVLDEADQMLDEGFLVAMARIDESLPRPRQTVLCSATLPPAVRELARRLLRKPFILDMPVETATPKRIRQRVLFIETEGKPAILPLILQKQTGRIIVFVRTKANLERVARLLRKKDISLDVLHGDRTQGARHKALDALRAGHIKVLVTTDIAARGLDVDDIMLVVNYDLPDKAETYVHRIGRTARGGKKGEAITLCAPEERTILRQVEKDIGYRINAITPESLS